MSYLGSHLHEFWSRCGEALVHPDDLPFFRAHDQKIQIPRALTFDTATYGPWPFDGSFNRSRIVICMANPLYAEADSKYQLALIAQRSGEEDLPNFWSGFYRRTLGPTLNPHFNVLKKLVTIFNVCPYPSARMREPEIRFAQGLPSVWAAQKHLREVLIPLALTGNIYLVVLRKHSLWGIQEGFSARTLKIVRRAELTGVIPEAVACDIRDWLMDKGLLN